MTSRCKFTCTQVSKVVGYGGHPFLYAYNFVVVTNGSEENKQFFASTPNGELKISAVQKELFEPGKSYYLDISDVEQAA